MNIQFLKWLFFWECKYFPEDVADLIVPLQYMTQRNMTNRRLSIWNYAGFSAVICYVCHKLILGKLCCNILYVSSYWKYQFTVWEPGISAILAPCEAINDQSCCRICFVWSMSLNPLPLLQIFFLSVILPKFHLYFWYHRFIFTCPSHRNLHFITQTTFFPFCLLTAYFWPYIFSKQLCFQIF